MQWLLLSCLLPLQLRFKCLFTVSDVTLVACRIDKSVVVAALPAPVFLLQSEVAAMSAEKNVAGQALEHLKAMMVVRSDLRIGLVVHQLIAGIHIWTADDDHVESTAGFGFIKGPSSGSSSVARG